MKRLILLPIVLLTIGLIGCQNSSNHSEGDGALGESNYSTEDGVKVKRIDGFGGKIAKSYDHSEEWWDEPKKPAPDAPNVIIFLLDDTEFAQVGSFGGLVNTPNIDQLAENGLRFNNFYTTALCSPSRASLMAGRNPHSIGLGSHSLTHSLRWLPWLQRDYAALGKICGELFSARRLRELCLG